jgi:ureidoglycolate hydrolase
MSKSDETSDIRPRVMSEKQATQYLGGISHATFWSLIKKGELVAVDIGGTTKVTVESADALIERGRHKRAERVARSRR